jgi:hypothetical protein
MVACLAVWICQSPLSRVGHQFSADKLARAIATTATTHCLRDDERRCCCWTTHTLASARTPDGDTCSMLRLKRAGNLIGLFIA